MTMTPAQFRLYAAQAAGAYRLNLVDAFTVRDAVTDALEQVDPSGVDPTPFIVYVSALAASDPLEFVTGVVNALAEPHRRHPLPVTGDPVTEEPPRRGDRVRDRDGDVWQRGNSGRGGTPAIWTHYGRGGGRLRFDELLRRYGPLTALPPYRPTRR